MSTTPVQHPGWGAIKPPSDTRQADSTYKFTEQTSVLHEAKFTDFEIKCGEHTFNVHRIVICSQSPFFSALAGGDFKEATEQSTVLCDEDPALLVRYLLFLYSNEYPESKISELHEDSQFTSVQDEYASDKDNIQACYLHARMYVFSRRRCDDKLEQYALQRFSAAFWGKRRQRDAMGTPITPRGLTRTLKYHIGRWKRDEEQTLIVGTMNTRAELYEVFSDFATWDEVHISQRQIPGADAPPPPRISRGRRSASGEWKENPMNLKDFDFDHTHIVIGRSPSSNAKNLSLLSSLERWENRIMPEEEQDLFRFVLSETLEQGTALKDILAFDLLMRKHSGQLIPDPTFRKLQLEFAEFFLGLDLLVKPSESRQCQTCYSIQPVLRQSCSCGKWSDACESDCLSKEVAHSKCLWCHTTGNMKTLESKPVTPGSVRGAGTYYGVPFFEDFYDDF